MATKTISIDDDLLRRADAKAARDGTSVDAIIVEHLRRYTDDDAMRALEETLDLAAASDSGSGRDGQGWNREELYGRASLRSDRS